ncbi:lytic transglycosylase domain-containing protein [uncultured Parasphingorhabdus sp.]|uniref:lytic transglycosylase domain-containing protein n=1 Tax=uncultured Parasphingorhabdus sp. TaxID=2709694 RepID=UPI0030DC2E3A|tara:strand:+ start:26513 stop:27142 length:630 start_codon:yes stop_codon:yes gene_type:complete
MRRLRLSLALITLVVSSPAAANSVDHWQPHITEASLRFGIPEHWIKRVMRAESAGNTTLNGRPIRSHAGAMGLMQVMPATWAQLTKTHRLGPNPDNPRANILAGTAYLRDMYDRFGYPGLFAAYNAGPGRYRAYLQGRSRLPAETVAYVRIVAGRTTYARSVTSQERTKVAARPPDVIFYRVQSASQNGSVGTPAQPEGGLFAIRKNDQ